jgi:hypothetical protein
MNAAAPTKPRSRKTCFLWGSTILLLGAFIGVWTWWSWENASERDIAFQREWARRIHWEARLFPAKVTFQRGAARDHDLFGSKPWRDVPGEFATCPDDSEGRDFAEFYQTTDSAAFASRAFADDTHPEVARRLSDYLETEAKTLFATAIILSEAESDGWKLRTTFFPTPQGSKIIPENLPAPVLSQLNHASVPSTPTKGKPYIDPRHAGSTNTAGRNFAGRSRQQIENEAEARAERKYKEARDRHDNRHHHLYLVEAVRDFGNGRIIVLRRFGQVYGPGTITRAAGIVQDMAKSVTISPP